MTIQAAKKTSPEIKLATARLWAQQQAPYLTIALCSLLPYRIDDENFNTFGVTENGIMYWSPAAVERWSVEEIGSVLLHEVSHYLRDHADRARNLNAIPIVFNIAADLEINDDLMAMGLPLPEGVLTPEKYGFKDGQLAEAYYQMLREQGEDGSSLEGNENWGEGCGSGAGNPGAHEKKIDPKLCPGRSATDKRRIQKQTAEDIKKHAEGAGRGTNMGGWSRWADDLVKPAKIPWHRKLARAAKRAIDIVAGNTDIAYDRPSRWQGAFGWDPGSLIMPRTVTYQPRVTVAVDTSGSMGEREISQAVSETLGIMNKSQCKVNLCTCDAGIQGLAPIENKNDVAKLIKGGGGTDFRPVFDAIKEERLMPDIVVFITDGGGPAPAKMPIDTHIIWVLVGAHRQKPWKASDAGGWESHGEVDYGEFIEIDPDDLVEDRN